MTDEKLLAALKSFLSDIGDGRDPFSLLHRDICKETPSLCHGFPRPPMVPYVPPQGQGSDYVAKPKETPSPDVICNRENCHEHGNAKARNEARTPSPIPYIRDYATGVAGTYVISRMNDSYSEFWNPSGKWAGSGYVFTDLLLAEAVLKLLKEKP